ncbi:unnamed protein product [Prorocentrum cordatum]|uniref:Uncharacterized protein n=1 Tax=Prorocentrum cordatum TaxID=2364126 RepID=A0ABN9WQY1_9DINO|nr:unnamed protein product [Polarella glacialis]
MTKRRGERRSAEDAPARCDWSPAAAGRPEKQLPRRRSPSSCSPARRGRSRSEGLSIRSSDDQSAQERARAPDVAPGWLSEPMNPAKDTNKNIAKLNEDMPQEIDGLRFALHVHDQNVQSINARLTKVEQNSDESIRAAVATAIDTKLEVISAQIDVLRRQPPLSSAASSGSSRTAPTPMAGTSMQVKTTDERKRWVGSSPRSLTRGQREAHWNSIKGYLPSSLRERVQPQFHGVAKSYVLVLLTPSDDRSLSGSLRSLDVIWVGPRDQGRHQVRVRQDLPLDVRPPQRAASSLWAGALELLRKSNHPPDGFKLGANGCQGLMHLTSESEVWELFQIKGSDVAGRTFGPVSSSWRAWSVQDSDAQALVTRATGEARAL